MDFSFRLIFDPVQKEDRTEISSLCAWLLFVTGKKKESCLGISTRCGTGKTALAGLKNSSRTHSEEAHGNTRVRLLFPFTPMLVPDAKVACVCVCACVIKTHTSTHGGWSRPINGATCWVSLDSQTDRPPIPPPPSPPPSLPQGAADAPGFSRGTRDLTASSQLPAISELGVGWRTIRKLNTYM